METQLEHFLDPEYMKALDTMNIPELNKFIQTQAIKGGSLIDPTTESKWYQIAGTKLSVYARFDSMKGRFYVTGIALQPDEQGALKKMEKLTLVAGSSSDSTNRRSGASPKTPKTPKPKPPKTPAKPVKPKKTKGGASSDKAFDIDYEDVEQYGGKGKKGPKS
ncbi:hypothetical protein DLEV_077 [Diachasmimorpha longicaudata entomopoxvirus]|nr:hypothetical protein QKK69_gp077 [Diachasmimorpha longicaudata entomopoxvirus]AKS26368.1 hypothetical protein DLEV_077 [Diachasmimorpha longicaudata entomopoxvirus]